MTKKDMIALYNEHVEQRGDGKRKISVTTKITIDQVRRKLAKIEKEAETFCDMP